jgi:hypothetical protein
MTHCGCVATGKFHGSVTRSCWCNSFECASCAERTSYRENRPEADRPLVCPGFEPQQHCAPDRACVQLAGSAGVGSRNRTFMDLSI